MHRWRGGAVRPQHLLPPGGVRGLLRPLPQRGRRVGVRVRGRVHPPQRRGVRAVRGRDRAQRVGVRRVCRGGVLPGPHAPRAVPPGHVRARGRGHLPGVPARLGVRLRVRGRLELRVRRRVHRPRRRVPAVPRGRPEGVAVAVRAVPRGARVPRRARRPGVRRRHLLGGEPLRLHPVLRVRGGTCCFGWVAGVSKFPV